MRPSARCSDISFERRAYVLSAIFGSVPCLVWISSAYKVCTSWGCCWFHHGLVPHAPLSCNREGRLCFRMWFGNRS
ncbi:hypothetical protein BV20DRAFT_56095 [Pilatotrama ljubarskyi]|nr:hypothetical protein BV20DRAFT_56095 [Pilatotrama ljubarskyi]